MRFLKYIFCALLFVTASVADTININWINGDETYAQTTCEIGGDIILPEPPTKRGYTFKGWAAYTRLEYIESTGTQYIDTGYKVDYSTAQHLTVKTDMLMTTTTGYRLCGIGGAHSQFYVGMDAQRFAYGDGISDLLVGSAQADKWYNYEYSTKNGTFVVKDDTGVVVNDTFTFSSGYNVNYSIYLFAYNNSSTAMSKWGGKIKGFTVYYDNSVVLNFIPAKRNSDNAIGMYDTVSGQFFTNAGTGEFIAGPVAENQNL